MWTTNFWSELDGAVAELLRGTETVTTSSFLNGGFRNWPRISVTDTGDQYELTALLPGIAEQDLKIAITEESLSLSAERTATAPDGFSALRRERANVRFERNVEFASKVDPDRVEASVKNGVLTVVVGKSEQAKPRQISVLAAS